VGSCTTRPARSVLTVLRAELPRQALSPLDLMLTVSRLADQLREAAHVSQDRMPTATIASLPCLRVGQTSLPVAGYTFWDCHRQQWVVRLNVSESAEDRRFTLLHEFGHVVWHGYCQHFFPDLPRDQRISIAERAADVFASEALMPTDRVLACFHVGQTSPAIVAKHFGVSPIAALWRLEQIGLLPPSDPRLPIQPFVHPRPTPLLEEAA